jgi:hypothetical protein
MQREKQRMGNLSFGHGFAGVSSLSPTLSPPFSLSLPLFISLSLLLQIKNQLKPGQGVCAHEVDQVRGSANGRRLDR